MLDPLSVAGLALAVFHEVLKLGAKTAEVAAEMRSFDDVSKGLQTNMPYNSLPNLEDVYGDESLIQKFDIDAQEYIRSDLDELLAILERILKLLSRVSVPTAAAEVKRSGLGSYARKLRISSEAISGRSKSPLHLLKWSFRDKKDLTSIVERFTGVNNRLSEMVRFWSLASDIGVDLGHLQHLRSDEDAVTLGCRDDASLALAASDISHISESFELDSSIKDALRDYQKIEDRFATFTWNGKHTLQENCVYTPSEDDGIDPQSRNRINALAELLHQPKEPLFCILACQGWRYLPESQRMSYIFNIPSNFVPKPESLLRLLNDRSAQPSLEVKFRLAHHLARCMAQLHLVKWVHESFRSENVLFFPQGSNSASESKTALSQESVDLKQPWVFGFEFSRPDLFFSHGLVDACPERDVYRHPERQSLPVTTFKKIHDIYALGVVLLEIGIWRPAVTLEKHHFAHAHDTKGRPCGITQHLIKHAQTHLENPMGKKYRDVVLKCLMSKFGVVEDNKEDFKLQQAFRTQVLEPLRKIKETI